MPSALIKVLAEKQVKAEGNFFGSIAPSLWAQGMEINGILYADYGIKMLSNVVACKRETVEKKSGPLQELRRRIDGRPALRLSQP